jgi:hypothetical protein
MLKNILFSASLLLVSQVAQAGLLAPIEYNGYSRDAASNVVTGGGLEWLKWDVTHGMSVDSAITTYYPGGWTLATTEQMMALFNAFQFGKSNWGSGGSESVTMPWAAGENSPHNQFLELFGHTEYGGDIVCSDSITKSCLLESDGRDYGGALYGDLFSGGGFFSVASVMDDLTRIDGSGVAIN